MKQTSRTHSSTICDSRLMLSPTHGSGCIWKTVVVGSAFDAECVINQLLPTVGAVGSSNCGSNPTEILLTCLATSQFRGPVDWVWIQRLPTTSNARSSGVDTRPYELSDSRKPYKPCSACRQRPFSYWLLTLHRTLDRPLRHDDAVSLTGTHLVVAQSPYSRLFRAFLAPFWHP